MTVISNEECKKKLVKFNVEPAHICAFSRGMSGFPDPVQPFLSGVDSCSGDSGGPATLQEGGRITQVNAAFS